MNETIYKVALAGLFHDIGKFAERANMEVSQQYLDNNAALYQPFYNGRYSHRHAVFTAAFIEHHAAILPAQFNAAKWGDGDAFVNLAAGHHKPETPLQWIVAISDRVSSGFDREQFDDYNKGIDIRDYKKTRMIPIFEEVFFHEKNGQQFSIDAFRYRYTLRPVAPDTIFPVQNCEISHEVAEHEYENLLSDFVYKLSALEHRNVIHLWLEHFESLFCKFASNIPAATVGNVIPDVSLYDHCKATAALSAALYLFHVQTDTLNVKSIQNYDEKKFLIVTGDFYGIQDFIFSEGNGTRNASAKLLRGRSFAVSLLSELAADFLCRMLSLPTTSIILNAAGKFTIIAPATHRAKKILEETELKINSWFHERYFGQCVIGISHVEASGEDFITGNFPKLWEQLVATGEEKKYRRYDISVFGGPVKNYLDNFNNTLDSKICPFCNKRPSVNEVENDYFLGDEHSACSVCRDHLYIGTRLVKASRIAIANIETIFDHEHFVDPIFDYYQISLNVNGSLSDLAEKGNLYKYWDISLPSEIPHQTTITAKYINNYIPAYTDEDRTEEALERLLHGEKTDRHKEELFDLLNGEGPKVFLHIAKEALNKKENGKFSGIEALGVLKADVDNLGLVFGCGLQYLSLSRLATLSRQMNNFFAIYVPYILSTQRVYRNIYTVFSGGDDLFLIGPWNNIIDFATFINERFCSYVCKNEVITLSAGISVNKPNEPVSIIAERGEEAVKHAKKHGKNSVSLFGIAVTWQDFKELEKKEAEINSWLAEEKINNAMLFRFNEFAAMASIEKSIREKQTLITPRDWNCLKWRSMFRYSIIRNVGKKLKNDEKVKTVEDIEKSVVWFEKYGSAMKIPIWKIIYNQR